MKRNGFSIKTERESGVNTKGISLHGKPELKCEHEVKTVTIYVSTADDVGKFEGGVKYLLDHGYEVVGTHAVSDFFGSLTLIAFLIKRIVREDDVND